MKNIIIAATCLMSLSLSACGLKSFCDDYAQCTCEGLDGCDIQLYKEACEVLENSFKESCGKTYNKYMECFDYTCNNNELVTEMTGDPKKCAFVSDEYKKCQAEAIAK